MELFSTEMRKGKEEQVPKEKQELGLCLSCLETSERKGDVARLRDLVFLR